mgnify:CR=1 FL=1
MSKNILKIIQNDPWSEIFLRELPLLGVILALIVTLQIWGLLPQPTNDENEQLSSTTNKKNMDNENPNKESIASVDEGEPTKL